MGNIELSLVIRPNERENIGILLERAHKVLHQSGHSFEIIVVDDDSPDRTWSCSALITEYPRLRVIRRVNERGLARAVVRGWQEARGNLLAVMDGDLQHPAETLQALVQALQQPGVDIAVASRHTKGGGVRRWNVIRRAISWMATLAATWVMPGTLATVRDPIGFFALRRPSSKGGSGPEGLRRAWSRRLTRLTAARTAMDSGGTPDVWRVGRGTRWGGDQPASPEQLTTLVVQ